MACVSPVQLAALQVGRKVTLGDPTLPGSQVEGEIARMGVAADLQTKTFPVEIVTADASGALKPGQVVHATCELARFQDAISIPRETGTRLDESFVVYVVRDEVAKVVPVTLGATVGNRLIVASGLQPGDQVVVTGQDALVDGSLVEVINPPAPPEGKTAAPKSDQKQD